MSASRADFDCAFSSTDFVIFFVHAFTHLHHRLSSDQGRRAGLCILMGGVGSHCPQIHKSLRSVRTTVQHAACPLKGLTHTIPIVNVAQAWLPCRENRDELLTNQALATHFSHYKRFAVSLAWGFSHHKIHRSLQLQIQVLL